MVSDVPTAVANALGFDGRPLAIVIWRTGCSTSRYMMPFWQRLWDRNPTARVVSVCQDDRETTEHYCRDNRLTVPTRTDMPGLTITRALEVDTVPSFWLVNAEGNTKASGFGWDKAKIAQIDEALGGDGGLYLEGESVLDYKPG